MLYVFLQQGDLPDIPTKTKLVIPAANLPSSGVLTITATMTRDGASADAKLDVPLNAKPAVMDTFAVTASSNTFPGSSFAVSAANTFYDDDTLR